MIRTLSAILLVVATALPVLAQPVQEKTPRGMQQGHVQIAAQAAAFEARNGQSALRGPAGEVAKKWNSYGKGPVGNMTLPDLRSLASGNYLIHKKGSASGYAVAYYAQNGVLHTCSSRGGYKRQYWIAAKAPFGTGLSHKRTQKQAADPRNGRKAGSFPQPMLHDSRTGQVRWGKGKRSDTLGWFQKEIPAVTAQRCADMPRGSGVNAAQTDRRDMKALAAVARPIRGRPTIFQGVIDAPLTGQMLVHLHPYD